ncbi:MAG: tetratricopeptide repeat protein [Candidatus Latescibacteria bacterium]|nr:tetratricopeptide repeat protein [Candidatus Latescibacterota bacterium]
MSCAVFAATSPYIFMDFDRFREDIGAVAQHTAAGRGDLGPAWWYHIHFTTRHNLGWLGGGLTLVGIATAWRNPQGRILLACALAYYLLISTGSLVFVRYAVPLAALQCALAAGALVWLCRQRLALAFAGLALVEPLYGSTRVARLSASPDTRAEARQWLEAQVPSGATLCNFGGWAGDPQVETFEHLWWRIQYYERNVGFPRLEDHLTVFNREADLPPHCHYAIQFGNRQHLTGSMDIVDEFDCSHVVLHRHPLGYSNVDSAFAAQLGRRGTRLAHFAPAGLDGADPSYDPIDAYYVPLGAFGALGQAGPDIEIWAVGTPSGDAPPRPRQALGAAYMSGAVSALDQGDPLGFQSLAARALGLDPGLDDARYRLKAGDAQRRLDRPRQTIAHWQRAAELDPAWADPLYNIGLAYRYDLGDGEAALTHWQRALALQADHVPTLEQIAAALRQRGDFRRAAAHWQRVVELDPRNADACYNLGLIFLHQLDQPAEAKAHLRRVLALQPDHPQAAQIRTVLDAP